jgi:hypothetical protein
MARSGDYRASAWQADLSPLAALERSWRRLAAALTFLRMRLFPPAGRIHVPDVSAEWLTRHASESGKHLDD